MTTLARLQRWYASQCDGDWEHHSDVEIGTLDNPGWSVDIDLADAALGRWVRQRIPTFPWGRAGPAASRVSAGPALPYKEPLL